MPSQPTAKLALDDGTTCTDPAIVGDDAELVRRANAWPGLVGIDLCQVVAPSKSYTWSADKGSWAQPKDTPSQASDHRPPTTDHSFHVVAIDCGLKRNIL